MQKSALLELLRSPLAVAHIAMRAIGEALVMLVITVFMFMIFSVFLMNWQTLMISSASQYENVLEHRWHRSDLIEHFPKSIPTAAREVRFHFNAAFLQGGSSIELRARLPAEVIEGIERTYRPRAKGVFDAAGDPVGSDQEALLLPKLGFRTVPPQMSLDPPRATALPADFETLLLWSSEPVNLNHPHAGGISISRQRGEVVYWAEGG